MSNEVNPSETSKIRISVILTDFVDHRFAPQAIQSVLSQTIPSELVELIVITDGRKTHQECEGQWKSIAHRTFKTSLTPLGQSYAVGVLKSSGDIVTFLDNDDVWSPNRLERVLTVFDAESRTTFFKNSVSPIFSTSDGYLRKQMAFNLGLGISPLRGAMDFVVRNRNDIRVVSALAPMHNTSSMAFRRAMLLPYLPEISRVPAFIDPFLFFISMIAPGELHFTRDKLTGYRVRTDSASARQSQPTTRGGSNLSASHFLEGYRRNLEAIDSLLRGRPDQVLRDIRNIVAKSTECFIHFRSGEIPVSTIVEDLPESLRLSLHYRTRSLTVALTIIALEGLFGRHVLKLAREVLDLVTT